MNFMRYLRTHKKNDDTAYEVGGATGILALMIVSVFVLALAGRAVLQSGNLAAVITSVLVDLTNSDRSAGALGDLAFNPILTTAAQAKANDMAIKGYFAHVSPDGKNSWYWFKEAGYSFTYAGENLAVDFSDSIDVERAWMNSPSHRANILNGHYTEIGIASAQGYYQGRLTTFVVQMFGSPASKTKTVPVLTTTSPNNPTQPAFATTTTTNAPVLGASNDSDAEALESSVEALMAKPSSSWFGYVLASPGTMLQYAYYVISFFVLVFLAIATGFEIRRHHLRHVVEAIALVVLMVGLVTAANVSFFAEPVLAAPQEAN